MPQDVQFQKVVVDGMVVKMRRHNVRGHIVGWVLYRGERIDGLSNGQHNDPAGMLSGGPADAGAPQYNPVDLTVSLAAPPLFIVFFYITKCCFICQRSDSSCPVCLPGAKDHLGIFMCL